MNFRARLGILFYEVVILFFAGVVGMFVTQYLPLDKTQDVLAIVYQDWHLRLIIGLIALIIVLKTHMFSKTILGAQQKGRNIAFDNPSGRVSVSLSAVEDMVRRIISRVSEVKDARAAITAGKKGLDVSVRLSLNADVNIPEMTSRIQDLVKRKIQDIIGLEESVVVRVDIIKILSSVIKEKPKVRSSSEQDGDNVPFQGYRA